MLKTILEQYRNGERGLPTYDELAAIAGGDHDGHARINGGACRTQADARPVGFTEQWELDQLKNGCVARVFPTKDEPHDVALFTHPAEASAPGLSDDDVSRKPRLDTAEMLEMRITEAMTRLDEAKAEVKELRHALSIARDQMRVTANWFKFCAPAEHRFADSAINSVNAVLERGEPT